MQSTSSSSAAERIAQERPRWQKALDELPDVSNGNTGKIPTFFFAHGSPLLIWPSSAPAPERRRFGAFYDNTGPHSPLSEFLKDFGAALKRKYNPRAIVVFSAHWESDKTSLVTNYGDENPLLYDYYGFNSEFYQVKFVSKGDSTVSKGVVEEFKKAGIDARTVGRDEPSGRDGRGFLGPGLDHGVFVPFKLMFGDSCDIPVVEVSLDSSLDPKKNWALGKALNDLRSRGILILSGGLTIHTFEDASAYSESDAHPDIVSFHKAILDSVTVPQEKRKDAMVALTKHKGLRRAHPREEHFIPIYIAAGAGEDGQAKIISNAYGAPTFAFGL